MAHKPLIGGTSYEISGGKTLVNGTAYSISGGKTLVGGTAYNIGFGTPIGNLAVGSSVYMNVNGVPTEFLVVHQGLPLPVTFYDSSCDGTWLLMKDLYEVIDFKFGRLTFSNRYYESAVQNYMNSTILGLFDTKIQSIIKQVKIPYIYKSSATAGSVYKGANGLSTKIFLLSYYEMQPAQSTSWLEEGRRLSYFYETNTSGAEPKRVAYFNGTATDWWLRTPEESSNNKVLYQLASGSAGRIGSLMTYKKGIRPAMILPSDAKIDENFNVIP